jgi:hypothetical protein
MKKLAVAAMILATATLMVPAMASANWYYWWGIRGSWEMVATGTCLHSTQGFTFNFPSPGPGEGTLAKPFVATANGDHFSSSFLGEGIWTFDGQGKGKMQVVQYCIRPDKVTQALMPSSPLTMETVPFDYEVEDQTIKVIIGPPVNLTLVGKISKDYQTMTLLSTMQYQAGGPTGHQVCNIGRILMRVKEVDD